MWSGPISSRRQRNGSKSTCEERPRNTSLSDVEWSSNSWVLYCSIVAELMSG